MGSSKYTYIGPFLTVSGKVTKNTPKVKRVCPNHPNKERNDKFCPTCGTLIESVDYIEAKQLSAKQIAYEFDDSFYNPEYSDAFMPNDYPPNKIKFDENGGSINLLQYADKMISDINWFEKTYESALVNLRNKLGVENVNVQWGVVTYWS